MATPGDLAGYRAAVPDTWALGRRRTLGDVPTLAGDSRDEGAPAGAGPALLAGWRAGIDSATW